MSSSTFTLEVVTPDRMVLKDEVDFVKAKGVDGDLGILPNHSPLATALKIGIFSYTKDRQEHTLAISGGFMEVSKNKVSVLANTAEKPEEIDVARAQSAKERAEQRLRESLSETDHIRAETALKRALNRLQAVERK